MSEGGSLNRVVELSVGDGEARAVLHDDFHHFRVRIRHAEGIVTAVAAETLRGPFSLCGDAGEALHALEGLRLTTRATDIFQQIDARLQCTHQFDLAAFAIAAAARGAPRRYEVCVPDVIDDRTIATITRDGMSILAWGVRNYAITDPPEFSGRSLGHGFTEWVSRALDEEEGEAALVLRRGIFVSRGRLLRAELNARLHAPITGACWVQQPERAPFATRPKNVIRDYSEGGVPVSEADVAWLAGARATGT